MATEFSFSFDTSQFTSPEVMDKRLQRAVFGVAKYWDGRMEAYAKHKAPWKDRTSNARNGLFAQASKIGTQFIIILAHSVTYGVYLEVGTSKMEARPIIMPTIRVYAPKVVGMLNKIMDRL